MSSSKPTEPPPTAFRFPLPKLQVDVEWSDAAREVPTGSLKYATMAALMRQGARAVLFGVPALLPLPENADSKSNFVIDINVVGDDEIQALNREYRDQDKPTDVLSFSQLEEPAGAADQSTFAVAGEKVLLGDIVISLSTAKQEAEKEGYPLPEEMAFLTVHGVLHLLGYDHMNPADKKVMWEHQNAIMERVFKWPPDRKQ